MEGLMPSVNALRLREQVEIPVIVAPMFLCSGVDLVAASCVEGVIGTFPALNGRKSEDFDRMLCGIEEKLDAHRAEFPNTLVSPYGVNLIVHPSNPRLEADLALCVAHEVPLIITSLGKPTAICEAIHAYGGIVLSDVANVEHARKAAACGVDGLILVCAGAGGHAGRLSPFAFVPAVREFFEGIVVVGGCISEGRAVRACEALGADFAYMGTRFIPVHESLAVDGHKDMIVDCGAEDVVYTPAVTGVPANFLRPSLKLCGYDIDRLDQVQRGMDLNIDEEKKAWRDTWSAGQGIQIIHGRQSVRDVVAGVKQEYGAAFAP
jgi:nitronate monooxygenase